MRSSGASRGLWYASWFQDVFFVQPAFAFWKHFSQHRRFRAPFGTPAGRQGSPKIAHLGPSRSKNRKNDVQERVLKIYQNFDRNLTGKMMPKGIKMLIFHLFCCILKISAFHEKDSKIDRKLIPKLLENPSIQNLIFWDQGSDF